MKYFNYDNTITTYNVTILYNGNIYALTDILKRACDFVGVSPIKAVSLSQKRELVQARQLYMTFAHIHTKDSLTRIGALVKKDHSTVLHGKKKCTQESYFMMDLYTKFENYMLNGK